MSASTPRIVGRDAELAVLRDAFEAGRAGEPRVVVIRGEAGIGKTRLLQEFLVEASRAAASPPVVIAAGQCIDMGPIGAPFTPVRRLLRELYVGVGDEVFRAAAQTPTVESTLATLVPDLDRTGEESPGGAPYIAEAIERVLENLSVDHHLLLVIEDLHWADAATLALLKALAVTVHGAHLTMIMTYRSDDVGRHHPLRPVLTELDRNRSVTGLEIGRLDAEQTTRLAALLAPGLTAESLAAVIARSEGVPFFVEELVDVDDIDLPETLREIVLARFARLTQNAQEVVGLVASGGVHVAEDLLIEVHAGDPADLRDGLHEALAGGVLVAGDDYSFRHALIQEAVRLELLPSERTALHRRYAAAMQARVDAGDQTLAAQAAEHWLGARDAPHAFDATVVALAHAKATRARSAAAQLGERLLDLWSQVPEAEMRAGTTRARLAVDISAQWRDAADSVRALRVARSGLAASPDDPYERAALHRAAAVALGNAGLPAEAMAEAEKAASLLEGEDDPASQALLSRTYSVMSYLGETVTGGPQRRAELARRAVDLAEESGDTAALSHALLLQATNEYDRGNVTDALERLHRGIESAELPEDRIYARTFLAGTLLRAGRFADAIAESERVRQAAVEIGLESLIDVKQLEIVIGEALLSLGEVEAGRARLIRAADLAPGVPPFHAVCLLALGASEVWDDHPDEAVRRRASQDAVISFLSADPESRVFAAVFDAEAALTLLESATEPVTRAALVDDAVRAGLALGEPAVLNTPGHSRTLTAVAARAAAAARRHERPGADALRDVVAQGLASLPADPRAQAMGALARAELAREAGAGEQDAWRDAVSAAEEGYVHVRYLHYARYRLAEVLISAGDRGEASALLSGVIADARSHGVGAIARWSGELAASAGILLERTDAAHARGTAAVDALTPRERQVLSLVAEGLTNRQIGQRLFISPKTASVHVSAILAKIGAANRTEAAALYTAGRSTESRE